MKTYFEKGDKVIYSYTHWLNSRSSFTQNKRAVFIRKVKDRSNWGNIKVVIQVEGNKGTSTVYWSEIAHAKKK